MNDRGEAASAGYLAGQATEQEERNKWEWKQTKAGAERKAGKDKENQVVFQSSHFSGIRTDTPYTVRIAQRDDNSCSPKRKWAGPGCEKGGRGLVASGSGRMSGKVGPRHLTPSNASRPGLLSRLDTRHSSQIRGLEAGPDFCAAMVDGGYAAAPVSIIINYAFPTSTWFAKSGEKNKTNRRRGGGTPDPRPPPRSSLIRERAQGLDDPAKGSRLLDGATKEND
ncbi:hypothetical protein CPAR01_15119 [Colletotrichum paranaense]|uniref:Uncharacterized protein n=1 Tax=Colletotrichum paranaense TaxID=1914294 RepID=A0ABQ9RZG7_9PEZI|nr:uncharacterized protein CPAR01_15119 [Colletotrichum paranaense]KAK1520068.1 hypothetical protein CPAR01_15119 [Colletotrichum paranaense]